MSVTRTVVVGTVAAALLFAPLAAQVVVQDRQVVVTAPGVAGPLIESALAGGRGSAALNPMPLGNGVIVGQTIDAATKRPVSGSLVTLSLAGTAPIRALADSEGRFAFRDLPKGRFSLTSSKAGFVDGAYGRLRPSGPTQSLELADGDRDVSISIPMWKYAAITGTVLDESGEPVVGTQVRAMKRSSVAGQPKLTMSSSDQTDDRGTFRITMLEPGEYVVAVPMTQSGEMGPGGDFMMAEVMATAAVAGARGGGGGDLVFIPAGGGPSAGTGPDGRPLAYQTQFYPSATVSTRAVNIAVASGEERAGVDFQLRAVRTQRVAGTVTGPEGPVARTQVSLVPADADALSSPIDAATTISDANGAFAFPAVPAGQYTVRVIRAPAMRFAMPDNVEVVSGGGMMAVTRTAVLGPGGGAPPLPTDPTLWAEMPLAVGNTDLADVVVPLRPGAKVKGDVQFSGSAEKPTPDRLPAILVSLETADGRQLNAPLRGRVENTGTFSTVGVPPGKYILRVAGAPQGWSFKGAMLGGKDVADQALEIEGADINGVTIMFTDRQTELSGSVTMAGGSSGDTSATVIVFPADRDSWVNFGSSPRRLRAVRADKTGAFSIGGLPPGDYLVAAVAEQSVSDWQNAKFLSALAPQARPVTLGDGQKVSQTLQVVK